MHLPQWLKDRNPWYIQTFNICNYTLNSLAALGVCARASCGADCLSRTATLRFAAAGGRRASSSSA